eukprot:CAMPEP_0198727180 /NCGR_PEP_ID=MMETSP1475-20131203/3989_1 /TAXON_ID= ORGANISM="Unidentified sp., Strain CCMP1999" /NCGR_SAMPLE_ID=MMETSP1475 /ASSEMBLY_ACC=CAM_ASM_001111 /LENGTH=605 /DNA_ID=CAMNT_0044489189 /DNA_START=200 /DNA_END=2018 /DNA_ORIENTATION=+
MDVVACEDGPVETATEEAVDVVPSFEDPIESWGDSREQQSKLTLRELMEMARPEWKLIGLALGCQMITSSVTMLFPMAFGQLVDGLQTPTANESLRRITSLLAGAMSGAAFATAARVATMGVVGERIARRLRRTLFESIMKQEVQFFERGRSGELVNRLSADVTAVSKFLTENLTRMVRSSVTACTGVGALFYLSPKLAFICITVLPIAAFTSAKLGKQVRNLAELLQDRLASSTQVASEKINALRTVRLFGAEDHEVQRYSHKLEDAFDVGKSLAKVEGVYTGANFLAANLTLATVLYIGGSMVISSEISTGTLTSVCMYMVNLGFGVSNLANAFGQLLRAQGCGARVHALTTRQPQSRTSTLLTDRGINMNNSTEDSPLLTFDQVKFGHNEKQKLLQNVNLSLQRGEIIAVTGPSGCGKSTLLALASRLYEPLGGSVNVMGENTLKWDPKALRSHIGVVPQDVVLFSGSIADNIAYPDEPSDREAICEAAERGGAHNFVRTLPMGYDTWVGERGATLSGGQKKLIGLARALYRKPTILVLDEALTGLDDETERTVADAIKALSKADMGILLIAHGNGPSIQIADRVVRLIGGVVEESRSNGCN